NGGLFVKYIFSFLKPYKLMIIVAYSFTLIELMTELLLPFFLGKMINDGVVSKDINNIIMWGSIMISLAFLAFISVIFNSFFAAYTSTSFAYDLREKLFTKIQSFSFKNLNAHPTSSLMTRFTNDVRQVQGTRSEERRVGKECRSRWAPSEENKKVRVIDIDVYS